MNFDMLQSFFTVIGIVCGFIITVTGAITGINKIREMMNKGKKEDMNNMKATLAIHTKEISEIKTDLAQVRQDTKENKDMTILICKGVKSLMDSSISGNGIENLKKTRKELDDYLIEKRGI